MDYNDNFDPRNDNDIDVEGAFAKQRDGRLHEGDRGYNVIYRMLKKTDGTLKKTKIELFTSSGTGTYIRDAETGQYYDYLVGSLDEDLFFKVVLATGECKSKNGSNTLFFNSPHHYMSHMKCEVRPDIIIKWEDRKYARLNEINRQKRTNLSTVIVN
jgi:hypothetical protein